MREIQRLFHITKRIFAIYWRFFQWKVRKTPYTRSPNLYHLKEHHLFKIVQLNKIPQLSKEERERAFGMLKSEKGNARLPNGLGVAIRRFPNHCNVLMLPIQYSTAKGAVVHKLPPPPLPHEKRL